MLIKTEINYEIVIIALNKAVTWKTHASTWDCALRELPSQKLYQRATRISKPLLLRGKLLLYSTGPLVAEYKRYNICTHIWKMTLLV